MLRGQSVLWMRRGKFTLRRLARSCRDFTYTSVNDNCWSALLDIQILIHALEVIDSVFRVV